MSMGVESALYSRCSSMSSMRSVRALRDLVTGTSFASIIAAI